MVASIVIFHIHTVSQGDLSLVISDPYLFACLPRALRSGQDDNAAANAESDEEFDGGSAAPQAYGHHMLQPDDKDNWPIRRKRVNVSTG